MEEGTEEATVLIVDDERGPRESLRMILAPNHRVIQVGSGAEALEVLATNHVDLVTLDLNMPGIKGQDLMHTIRSDHPDVEIIIITGCGSVESAADGIRSGICDYLQKPFDVVQVSAAVARALSRHTARGRLRSFLEELGAVVGRNRDANTILFDVQRSQKLKGYVGGILEQRSRIEDATEPLDPPHALEFLEVLAETIEIQDRFMRGHARRVAFYSSVLADRLCLSAEEHERLRISSFLHDLGKVGVPTDLLLRPGAIDAEERAQIERHPELGARLLRPLDIPSSIVSAVRHHHEWWDGTGYPDGLAGEEIPLAARIIGIVDAFDAMSCDRPFRRALSRGVIQEELKRFAGVQFDPVITKEFLGILETGVCDVDPELMADAIMSSRIQARADTQAS